MGLLRLVFCSCSVEMSNEYKPYKAEQLRQSGSILVSLSKRRFCQYGRHSKIGISNFDGILYHSARLLRKQKTYVLSYVLKITTN